MPRFALLAILLAFLFSQRIEGQVDNSNHRLFSGTVFDDSLLHTIPFVHIWNESNRAGSISDENGAFNVSTKGQDTLVFSAIGYDSYMMVVSSANSRNVEIRLSPRRYHIGELVVKRFRSYESFLYHVVHHELPDSPIDAQRSYIKEISTTAALEADRERMINDKVETGRFGYITPLGKGIDRKKVFKEKMHVQKNRQRVIHAKFNRELVGDITNLNGDELTDFIAICNFSEDYLYETDLYAILDSIYSRLEDYLISSDSIKSNL